MRLRPKFRIAFLLLLTSAFGAPVLALEAPLGTPRHGHTMTLLEDGGILVLGGRGPGGILASAERLDPTDGSLSSAGAMLAPRTGHTAVRLADGRILIAGGRGPAGALDSTELYDPATGSFLVGPSLTSRRSGHTATWLADGRLLIAGGDAAGSMELYDPAGNYVVPLQHVMRERRAMHSAIRLADGSVLFAGGEDEDGVRLDSAELLLDLALPDEPVRGWMHAARVRPELRLLHDGKVQIFGGDDAGTLEVFDPAGRYFRAWTKPPQSAGAFAPLDPGAAAVAVPARAERWISGGVDDDGEPLGSVVSVPFVTAAISTDRIDYSGSMVPIVSGTGFEPGEVVRLTREMTSPVDELDKVAPTVLSAVAFPDGSFLATDPKWSPYKPNATFLVTALGEKSSRVAQTAYYAAPSPDPTRAPLVSGPTRSAFSIPIAGPAASVETELGELRWGPWEDSDGARAPILGLDLAPWFEQLVDGLSPCLPSTPPLHACRNDAQQLQVCFETQRGAADSPQRIILEPGPGDAGGQREVSIAGCAYLDKLQGRFELDGTFDAQLDFDPGEGALLPELRTSSVGSHLELKTDPRFELEIGLDLEITFEIPLIPLRLERAFEIEGTDMRGTITIPNVYLGISGGVEGFTVRPFLQLGEVVHEGPVPPREIRPISISPGFVYWPLDEVGVRVCDDARGDCVFRGEAGVDVVDYGEAEVKLYLTAKAGATAVFPLVVATIHVWFDANVGPYLRGNADLGGFFGGCEPWHVDVDAGIEAGAHAGYWIEYICDLDCTWTWHCGISCWGGCCFGWWSVSCELGTCDTGEQEVGHDWDWPLDIADFWETGGLTVKATTWGVDPDPDGYTVLVYRSAADPSGVLWDTDRQLTIESNGTATITPGSCAVWAWQSPTCAPLATYHDVGLGFDSVMWNCRALGSTYRPDVCLDSGPDLEFNVRCISVFQALRDTIAGWVAAGTIAEAVGVPLEKLLAQAEAARDTGTVPLPAPLAPVAVRERALCAPLMERFLQQVAAFQAAGQLPAEVAAVLLDRGHQVQSGYCGSLAVPNRTRTSATRAARTTPALR